MPNQNGEHRPFDIAVDPYSRVLYWTCAKKNTINITHLNGTPVGVIVEGDHYVPRYIVLNPLGGYVKVVGLLGGGVGFQNLLLLSYLILHEVFG